MTHSPLRMRYDVRELSMLLLWLPWALPTDDLSPLILGVSCKNTEKPVLHLVPSLRSHVEVSPISKMTQPC